MMYGCEDKPRFTVKWNNGRVVRTGTCDPNNADRSYLLAFENRYFLCHVGKFGVADIEELFNDVLVSDGYYDHEHTDWLTPEEFIKNGSIKA